MKYAFFLGCQTPFRKTNYEQATRKVAEKLEIELQDMPDGGCCGFPYESVNEHTYLAMAARVLSMGEEMGLPIMTICTGCSLSLQRAKLAMDSDDELRSEINKVLAKIGRRYNGTVEAKHMVRVLYEDIGMEALREAVSRPLDLKCAAHYGCHLLRPSEEVRFEDPEDASSLDQLIEVTGATAVDYYDKYACCGGNGIATFTEGVYRMSGEKLLNMKGAGAQVVVTACPFCNVMFDTNQRAIESLLETQVGLPVLHYPQLLGLAMGMDPAELGIDKNRVKMDPALISS